MTMQVFVGNHRSMIAVPVQCNVDGIPKESQLRKFIFFEVMSPRSFAPCLARASCTLVGTNLFATTTGNALLVSLVRF